VETSFGYPTRVKRLLAGTYLHPLHLARRGLLRVLGDAREYVTGRTLDLGSGNMRYRHLFPQITRYFSVDLLGNSAFERRVSVWGSGLQLPFASGSFDTVLCTEVLEHVPVPALLFQEAVRVLRPGGHLVLTTPQTWGLHEAPHDYYRFTEFGLRFLALQARLDVVRVVPTCGIWATVGQRLSSFLFFDLFRSKAAVLRVATLPACAVLQLCAALLDALCGQRGDPLDHLLIARKECDEAAAGAQSLR
jgi:SAM-dependent methyltransferase